MTPEERIVAFSLVAETTLSLTNRGAADPTRRYLASKIRGLQARLDEAFEGESREIWARFMREKDNRDALTRFEARGYNDGYEFDNPNVQYGIDGLNFQYDIQPEPDEHDLAWIYLVEPTGQQRQCLRVELPIGSHHASQHPDEQNFAFADDGVASLDNFGINRGSFNFEGGRNYQRNISANSLRQACEIFFLAHGAHDRWSLYGQRI